jgi:hypothetical protein
VKVLQVIYEDEITHEVMEKFTRAFGSRFVELNISKFGIICLDPGETERSEDLTRGL